MASTGIRTTVPPLHHLDRRHGALPPSGTATCRFFSSRKQFGNPLLTLRSPSVRSNAFVGFEPETRRGSFYDLLEVPREVSFEEIKRAYRRLALRYHPDVSPPDLINENARRFMEIQEAYQTLSDPVRRQVYDSALHLGGVSATTSGRWLFEEELYNKANWKRQWQDQLEKLKRRSRARESCSGINSDCSWGARMRQRWTESPIL